MMPSANQVAWAIVAVCRKGERKLRFWDEGVFARVITAVKLADADEPLAPKAPIKLSAKVASIVEPKRPAAVPGKRKLEDIMREAVINTQRMTPPPEE